MPSGVMTFLFTDVAGSTRRWQDDPESMRTLLAEHDDVLRRVVAEHKLIDRCAAVLFSPVHGVLDPKDLAAWILEDKLEVRLQLQVHKFIWGPDTRGV